MTSTHNPGETPSPAPAPRNPPAKPVKRKPSRWRRRFRRLVLGGVAFAVVGWLLLSLALPRVVKRQVSAALAGLGVRDARFIVQRATPWRTTLADVHALAGDVRIGSIDVTYEPWDVVRGRLEQIRIEGADVRAVVRDGKLVSPSLELGDDAENGDDGGGGGELPFRSLEIAASQIRLDWDGQGIRLPVSGMLERAAANRVAASVSVQATAPEAGLNLPGGAQLRTPSGVLLLEATAEVGLGAKTSVVGEVRLRGAALAHPASGASLDGITMRVPVTLNAESTKDAGSFEFAAVTLGGEKLAPATGTLAVRDKRVDFSMSWAALPGSVLTTKGWLEMGDEGLVGEIAANLPAARLDDAATLAGRVPALRGWKVTATGLAADAALAFERGKPRGTVTVKVTGADVASNEAGAEIHDVNGAVTVRLTDGAVSTPAVQNVSVGRVAFGEVELTDAALAFRFDPAGAILVDQLSAGWLGGRVSTKGVRIDPDAPKVDVTLVADGLSLRKLLELTAEGRARGEGLMSGRVALRFEGAEMTFLGGQLRSQSATGELQVLDTKWLGETMDKSDPRFTAERELAVVKERILTALADFSYDRLTFDFAEEPASRGRLTVSTHGTGRVGEHPQELDFTLNFRGVNDVLRHGLRLGEGYKRLTNPQIGR